MKIKSLTVFCLILVLLFIVPTCFASSDNENLTQMDIIDEEIVAAEEDLLADDSFNQESDPAESYFNDDSGNIEEPMLNDDFASTSIKYTNKNTFHVNASYNESYHAGTQNSPFNDLNSAFSSLSLNRSVTNIHIANGVYEINKTISLTKNLNIIGENPFKTIIKSNFNEIFFINKNNLAITFINLTFLGGNHHYGGAIYNNRSSVKLINTIFKENTAEGTEEYSAAGGAIYCESGIYKIYNSTFINNRAISSLNVYGAAIYNDMGTISVLNSKFINNSVYNGTYGSGGAIYNFNGFLTVYNSTFVNNTIFSNYSIGGGIYNYEAHNVYIINCSFNENKIYGNYTLGSAIANSASLMEVVNSTVINNLANGTGCENSTIYHINGFYNVINTTLSDNIIVNPKKYLLMCLEDQFIISQPFSKDLLNELPSKYDLRSQGLVTYAKNQGSSGACWAFTTIAALESYLLKFENITYDLSENNLKNVMGYKSENGTDWADGGNYQMALAYFLRWSGPVDEDDDYFSAYSTMPHYDLKNLKHVQGAMFIPIRMGYLDINQIKYAIMKYGALYTSIYGTSMTKNIYNSVAEMPNHAVTIVGWDDDYSASKFSGTKPPANGAFIIKNSWGSSYGEKGFGYVSYYDKTFAGFGLDSLSAMAFTDVENTTNYKDIYQYDILGNTFESIGYNNNTAWLANQFTAISNNPLSAFGLYTYGKSDYLVNIYVNNDLKYSQKGNIDYAGYHTVKLMKLVNLTKGDLFRIEVKLTTFDSLFPIAIESQRSGYSSKATASLNQSFISYDGIHWSDIAHDLETVKITSCLYNKTFNQTNVCLKAYTANVGDLKLNVISNTSFFYSNDVISYIFNLTNVGDYVEDINISFVLDDLMEIINITQNNGIFVKNKIIIKSLNNNESVIINLTCKVTGNKDLIENTAVINCQDNNQQFKFNLSYAGFTHLKVGNVTSLSKSNELINLTLTDLLLKPISNATLIFNFSNNENITLKTNEYGNAGLYLNLDEGNYTCIVYFTGDDIYKKSNQTFNIEIVKRNLTDQIFGIILNSSKNTFSVSLPEDATGNLTVNIGGKIYTKDIVNSSAKIEVNDLMPGDFDVLIIYSGDEKYSSVLKSTKIKITQDNSKKHSAIKNIRKSTKIIAKNKKFKSNKKVKKFTLTLKSGKKPVKKVKITLKIKNKTYKATTNSKGKAIFKIKKLTKKGRYLAKIKFAGNKKFKASSKKVIITIR